MPFSEEKDKKSWSKKVVSFILGASALGGAVWGILEVIFMFTAWHAEYEDRGIRLEQLQDRIYQLENGDAEIAAELDNILYHESNKGNTFQVGKRTEIIEDVETGIKVKVKKYRDWDGILHEVHKDNEMSMTYGIDYYFYIDKQTGNKIYVW